MIQIAADPATIHSAARFAQHERVVHVSDAASGLRAILAIHSTTLGPAFGGCLMLARPDRSCPGVANSDRAGPGLADANLVGGLQDALTLSRSVTFGAALAGVAMGGGMCVMFGDPAGDRTADRLLALGRAVDGLGGRFLAAPDMGTTAEDMQVVARVTRHVRGAAQADGTPCPATAFGVFMAIRAAVTWRLVRPSLEGVSVAVQGLGRVGYPLCHYLSGAGARLFVADPREDRVQRAVAEFGATRSAPGVIHTLPVDVFAPCAPGGGLTNRTVPRIGASIIAGSARNRGQATQQGIALWQRGVIQVPDYVANAGGLIAASMEGPGLDRGLGLRACESIHDSTMRVLHQARRRGIAPSQVADQMAETLLAPRQPRRIARRAIPT